MNYCDTTMHHLPSVDRTPVIFSLVDFRGSPVHGALVTSDRGLFPGFLYKWRGTPDFSRFDCDVCHSVENRGRVRLFIYSNATC